MTAGPRRADARRNYDLIVRAARDAVTEHGPDTSLDDIARRAGVGNATLYRHFPTRHALLVAVYSHEVDHLADAGRELLRSEPHGQAFGTWLRLLVAHTTARRGLATAALNTARDGGAALINSWHETLRSTVTALLADAQGHGSARRDIDPGDVLTLANAIAHAVETATDRDDQADRLLNLVHNGIAPRVGSAR